MGCFSGWDNSSALSNAEANAENIAVTDDVIFSFQPEMAVFLALTLPDNCGYDC